MMCLWSKCLYCWCCHWKKTFLCCSAISNLWVVVGASYQLWVVFFCCLVINNFFPLFPCPIQKFYLRHTKEEKKNQKSLMQSVPILFLKHSCLSLSTQQRPIVFFLMILCWLCFQNQTVWIKFQCCCRRGQGHKLDKNRDHPFLIWCLFFVILQ